MLQNNARVCNYRLAQFCVAATVRTLPAVVGYNPGVNPVPATSTESTHGQVARGGALEARQGAGARRGGVGGTQRARGLLQRGGAGREVAVVNRCGGGRGGGGGRR